MRLGLWLMVLCWLAIGGCDRAEHADSDEQGALVVYSAGPRPLAEFACEQYTKATGIPTELFAATTGQVMAKLEAEKYNPRADVVILASRLAAESLKRDGRLAVYRPTWLTDDMTYPDWHDRQGHYLSTSAAGVGIAVRREFYADDLEWDDFFTGRFPGVAAMPSPSRSGTAGDFVLTYTMQHPDTAWQQFVNLRAHGTEISGANSQAITSMLIGSHQAVFAAADYLILREIARGEPIVMHYPASGVPLVQRPIAILKHTPRREAAQRFVEFYFEPEVQTRIGELHLIPAIRQTPTSEQRRATGQPNPMPLDVASGLEQQGPILRRFQYEVERAVIVKPKP